MRARELLTPEERLSYTKAPDDIDERELAIYFTLTSCDLEVIKRHRKSYNIVGFAIQLCILRYLGWTLMDVGIIPNIILDYISEQLSIDNEGLELYATATKYYHLEEIKRIYGFKSFTVKEYRNLLKMLYQTALGNDTPVYLIETAVKSLKKDKIILPAITTIERAAWEARKIAENKVFKILCSALTPVHKEKLDNLILSIRDSDKTYLGWLKQTTGHSSPDTFLKVIEKLEYIRKLDLQINTAAIHPNRLRQLSKIGERYKPYVLRRFSDDKRYAILVAYLANLSQDLTDQAFEIHNRQILALQNKGRKAQEEIQKKNGKSINEKVVHFANLGSALIKARDENIDPFTTIESIMPWGKIVESVKEANDLLRPIDYDYLDLLVNKFPHLRKYTPKLLQSLKFKSVKSLDSLIKALAAIREMNEAGKRKLPDDAPRDFISNRWKKYVYEKNGSINRHYYEMAALTELCNHVKSGNIWIEGSKQHKDFNEYIISCEGWKNISDTGLAVNSSADNYIEERKAALQSKLKFLSENINSIEGIDFNKDGFSLQRLEKDTPEEAKDLSQYLYNLLPRIKLTDLLTEVANWTGFDKEFIHASTGKEPNDKEKTVVMATLMALGTNIGLSKMADSTAGVSYNQMANASQWRFYDEAISKAQTVLVNFHHKLELSSLWGKGNTSSSDGMRVQVGVSSLYADANPHYGFKKGVTIYRFTSDQYSSFYTKVINTNARDAIHVIDGLLYHETDLNIEEHYTDTAGYTDQVFGLSHLLGFRFAPRLRDLSDSRLYLIDKPNSLENIDFLFNGKINLNLIKETYDDVLRLAYSIKEGIVSGSLIMSKLGSYSRQNKVATALREMGRIEKTIFILNYITDKTYRKRIQKGLNKGEAMNALARAIISIGKHGEFREKALQDQLQRASALNILINAITIWNTIYLTQAINYLKPRQHINEELLSHVSPLAWEHINFLGDYSFDLKEITTLDSLKPLNIG